MDNDQESVPTEAQPQQPSVLDGVINDTLVLLRSNVGFSEFKDELLKILGRVKS